MSRKSNSVFLYAGDDSYLVTSEAKARIDEFLTEDQRVFGVEIIDAAVDTVAEATEACRRCLDALATVGFLAAAKVVWLRDASFLAPSGGGYGEDTKTYVQKLVAALGAGLLPGTRLLVTAPAVDKRSIFYKACAELGEVREFVVPDKAYLAERQAGTALTAAMESEGLSAAPSVQQALLDRIGSDTRQIRCEVSKLATYLGERRRIEIDDVRVLTSFSRDAVPWDFPDAFGRVDLAGALVVMRQLIFQKESPMRLIMALESRVRDLLVYRRALDAGWLQGNGTARQGTWQWRPLQPDVETSLTAALGRAPRSVNPYRVNVLAEQALNFSQPELERHLKWAVDAHEQLVTSSLPPSLVLELLLIRALKDRAPRRVSRDP